MLTDELKKMRLRMITVLIFVFAIALTVSGGAIEPITGAAFDSLIEAQDTVQHRALAEIHSDADGCHILGPIDPFFDPESGLHHLFASIRLLCCDDSATQRAGWILINRPERITKVQSISIS